MTNWRKYNGALIPDQPPHIEIDDGNSLIKKNISDDNAFFARWTTKFDCKEKTDFWYVICDKKLVISDYSRSTRSQIRRGVRRCEVKKVSHQFIMDNAYPIYRKAFDNYQGHLSPDSKEEFLNEYSFYNDEDIWDFWAVFEKESSELIAFSRNKIEFNQCEYCTGKFNPNFQRRFYPSEALFYTMNQYYLNEKNFKYVNDGARSISHETNIQSFLIQKFKFRKAYCNLNIIYNSRIGFLVKCLYSFRVVLKLLNFGPFIKLNILLNQEKIIRSYD